MVQPIMNTIDQQVTDIMSEVNLDEWSRQYWEQGEFSRARVHGVREHGKMTTCLRVAASAKAGNAALPVPS